MKEGKKPIVREEYKFPAEDTEFDEIKKKMEEQQRIKDEQLKDLIETAFNNQNQAQKNLEAEIKNQKFKHFLALASFVVVWIGFIFISN